MKRLVNERLKMVRGKSGKKLPMIRNQTSRENGGRESFYGGGEGRAERMDMAGGWKRGMEIGCVKNWGMSDRRR